MPIATGQFTITDYNDAPIINSWISANNSKTQGYSPDNDDYVPDYAKTPMTLTASLFISGTSVDILDAPDGIITNMKWYTNVKGVETAIPNATTRSYTVNTNLVNEADREYVFKCDFTQDSTGLTVPVRSTITINKVINGTGIADAVIIAPSGNVFKNANKATLPAECQLWFGSAVANDVTANSFKWWKMDGSGTGGSHGVGAGWKEIITAQNGYTIEFVTATHTSTITIPRADVFSSAVYMCTVQDPASKKIFKETINFLDTTDPIYVEIVSPGGNVFKNNQGSTILTAKVYQNGIEIDSATSGTNKYTYKWYKYDKDGNAVDAKNVRQETRAAIFTGKQLSVTHEDVLIKATFLCEIS